MAGVSMARLFMLVCMVRSFHCQMTAPGQSEKDVQGDVDAAALSLITGLENQTIKAGEERWIQVSFYAGGFTVPVRKFTPLYGRVMHLVVIGSDLDTFRHVHPEEFGYDALGASNQDATSLPFSVSVPYAGTYLLAFGGSTRSKNFSALQTIPVQGSPVMWEASPSNETRKLVASFTWTEPSKPLPVVSLQQLVQPAPARPKQLPESRIRTMNLYTVDMAGPDAVSSGRLYTYNFTVHHAANKTPVTDLNPFLGADAHVSVVRHDLNFYMHVIANRTTPSLGTHASNGSNIASLPQQQPWITGPSGPALTARLRLPSNGTYRLILQFKKGRDEMLYVPFDVVVGRFFDNSTAWPAAIPDNAAMFTRLTLLWWCVVVTYSIVVVVLH